MGLWILEPTNKVHVPGTVLLNEEIAHSEARTRNLKHGKGSALNVILVPQPSDDPNDPLNWSTFEKHVILFILALGAIVNGTTPVSQIRSDV